MFEDAGTVDRAVLRDLLASVGGDHAFLADLVTTYLADTPTLLAAMRQALAETSAEALRQAAHTLKSTSASLGALTLAELCRELEALSRGSDLLSAADRLARLEAEWARVQIELDAIRLHGL